MAPLVEIKNLKKYFSTPAGPLHAVDDVSFTIEEGKTVGVVGESGCGKSTLGRVLVHLEEATDGQILFEGKDVTFPKKRELRKLREQMRIIFQDPYSSLDPRMTVSGTLKEPLMFSSQSYTKNAYEKKIEEIMDLVGIDQRFRLSYPHELDGGRRQRVGIGRSLALNPKFIVCDEPVSALDVSIQAQVLNLLKELQQEYGLSYIFITHDLSVVKYISDDICVMYLGQLVEKSPSKELFQKPLHPYTKALLSAIPVPDIHNRKKRIIMQGELTSPINPKPGCRFAARCMYATEKCSEPQELVELEENHFVACWRAKELANK